MTIQSAATSLSQPDFNSRVQAYSATQTTTPSIAGSRSQRSSGSADLLSPDEQRQVQKLKEIDRKVRAHEQAHLSVGGDLVRGGASYSYQTGPDNQRYAVAGEVSIDVSPARTAKETIPKAEHIRATALAPADPSVQDRSVAARASQIEVDAQAELAMQKRQESTSSSDQNGASFYLGVAQDKNDSVQIGLSLDIFA